MKTKTNKGTKDRKYRHIMCDNCKSKGTVVSKGRVFGNRGKRQFECSKCGAHWQYGY